MEIRYRKVIRDLTSDYRKNSMLVLAIAMGVFGIGAIVGAYGVLSREMKSNYLGTAPASATLDIGKPIPSSLLDSVKAFPGIREAERHATVSARMQIGQKWYPMLLFVVDDFQRKRTNKINHVAGTMEPGQGTMLAERTALVVMQANIGDEVVVKTAHAPAISLRLTGTVHDPGLAPAWQEQSGYGYITLPTLHAMGETQGFDQLRILVSDSVYSAPHIRQTSEALADWLEAQGYPVHEIQVPPPGRHPHQSQMNAVLGIFTVFSFMILILGSILVSTSLSALMVKQVRQIGVMKTIGATSNQIAGLYFWMTILLSVVALLLAIPLSRLAASALYNQVAGLLNLELTDRSIPYWVVLLQIGAGVLVPLIATAFPVLRGSRLSIRRALDNYGLSPKVGASSGSGIQWLGIEWSDTFKLSLRNVFRQRARLVMTLGLLAAGGAMFMTALNVSKAWEANLGNIYTQRLYDQEIKLTQAVEAKPVLSRLATLSGVKSAEGWNFAATSFLEKNAHPVSMTYPDKGHGSFTMLALPVPTQLLQPTVAEGHWLSAGGAGEVVLNQMAKALSPGVKLGDSIRLSVEEAASTWKVVGFTEDVGSGATAYVSLKDFAPLTHTTGQIRMLRVAYADRSKVFASRKNLEIEALLEREKISVSGSIPVWLLHNAVAAHMKVLVNSLMAMAILLALVGMLGLMSTMSVNVLERTREIGVMRAIGATPRKIRNLVAWEGLLIGAFSIGLAFALSLLLSSWLGRFIGNMAFRTPLSLSISGLAFGIWVAIIWIGSYVATRYPARRANRISTREALAYE
jgi:putative ABC transport system permease protein